MKTIFTLLCSVIVLSLAGCSDSNSPEYKDNCGTEERTSMEIRNAREWAEYPKTDGNAKYSVSYTVFENKASFEIRTSLTGICSKEDPLISTIFSAMGYDPFIVECAALETGVEGLNFTTLPVNQSRTNYFEGSNFFPLKQKDKDSTSLLFISKCEFPTKGSWEADSIYFFDRLHFFRLAMSYRTPQPRS
jgi:hypothetical protein